MSITPPGPPSPWPKSPERLFDSSDFHYEEAAARMGMLCFRQSQGSNSQRNREHTSKEEYSQSKNPAN